MKAFPNVFMDYIPKEEHRGMDLRDYFAAKAMQQLIMFFAYDQTIDDSDVRREAVAAAAYKQADYMMKAREQ
jgi:hypothetical protein